MDVFRGFGYVSSYLQAKSFAWKLIFQYFQNYESYDGGRKHVRMHL